MKNNILFIFFISVIVLFLVVLSGKRSPQIPLNEVHTVSLAEQDCLSCHGEGMSHPRSKEHPPKDQCFLCHKRSKKKALQ